MQILPSASVGCFLKHNASGRSRCYEGRPVDSRPLRGREDALTA
jgi:hypothetical protein